MLLDVDDLITLKLVASEGLKTSALEKAPLPELRTLALDDVRFYD